MANSTPGPLITNVSYITLPERIGMWPKSDWQIISKPGLNHEIVGLARNLGDAQLFAASPDLLEAAQGLITHWDHSTKAEYWKKKLITAVKNAIQP